MLNQCMLNVKILGQLRNILCAIIMPQKRFTNLMAVDKTV